jgi:membrane protein
MGEKASGAITEIVKNSNQKPVLSGISGILGFLVLAVSASAIFTQLRAALDKINEFVIPKSNSGLMGFIKDKFFSMGLVFGFIFLSIVSLMFSAILTALFPSGNDGFLWMAASFVVNFLMFSVLFTLIYRFIPSGRIDWRRCRISGIVSAVFYLIGKNLIGLYLGKAGFDSSYGAAGSLVVFLAWVYYTGVTLLVSYEFSRNILAPKVEWKNILKDLTRVSP